MRNKYSKELLEEKSKISFSYSELCRNLGINSKGGTWKLIKKRVAEYEIDVSHFLGYAAYAGKRRRVEHQPWKRSASEILVDTHSDRVAGQILRRAMLESNVEYKCNLCGLTNWLDTIIILEVDHVDGNSLDCRLENLQFLCPNCHSQTDSFCKKKNTGKQCKYCKIAIKHPRVLCEFCKKNNVYRKNKIKWPSDEDLQKIVFEQPNYQIAQNLGISDTSLIKHCKKRGIKRPPRGYFLKKTI